MDIFNAGYHRFFGYSFHSSVLSPSRIVSIKKDFHLLCFVLKILFLLLFICKVIVQIRDTLQQLATFRHYCMVCSRNVTDKQLVIHIAYIMKRTGDDFGKTDIIDKNLGR
ncbi:hypothetical protein D3C71_1826260 [compost metagenome]